MTDSEKIFDVIYKQACNQLDVTHVITRQNEIGFTVSMKEFHQTNNNTVYDETLYEIIVRQYKGKQ
jgi:hypothetical protein